MIFRKYPIIISKLKNEDDNTYLAICPDLELATAIRGYDTLPSVCGAAMSIVHQLTTSMKQQNIPLPPATSMDDARRFMESEVPDAVTLISVIVAQSEEAGDNNDRTFT